MFYADKMHLSPKYLSAVVKKVSGQTPSNWIDGLVIMEAKNLLKYSEMNIQEIAYQMNFPNQSFFGKYFKQRTGMTPSTYRDI
jgi:AraC-like DNA-binding protein